MTYPNSGRTWLLVALAVAIPLWLTLPGDPAAAVAADRTPWYCVSCGPSGTADLLQNTLLLLPLGVGLALLRWPLGRSAALLLALPVAIELTQGAMAAGRDAALGDVLANAVGGVLGWFAGSRRLRLLTPGSYRVAPLAWGIFVAQLVATAILGVPSPVGPEPWTLRLVPEVPGRPAYRGVIVEFASGGRNILVESLESMQPLQRDMPDVEVRFTWDPSDNPIASTIARIDDARQWAITSVDRRGESVGVAVRTMAGRWRFREPTWLLAVPPGTAPGDTMTVSLQLGHGTATAIARSGAVDTRLMVPYGAQHGWALINPFTPVHVSATVWRNWTLAWLAGWGLLLGWSGHRTRWRVNLAWLAAAIAALLVATHATGAGATALECVALATGWSAVGISRRLLHQKQVEA